jgi:hypothetical protein
LVCFSARWISRCSLLLFLLKEPILSALPARVMAIVPDGIGPWLLGVAVVAGVLRWSVLSYLDRDEPWELVTIRCDPPLDRVTVKVPRPSK